jgi:hypothetical protein
VAPPVARRWWQTPQVRAAIVPVAVVVCFLAIGALLDGLAPGPTGPASSSYATTAGGLAAWAELLRRDGHPVSQLRAPLSQATLDPQTTVVLLDPDALLPSEGRRLKLFLNAGGRLIAGGAGSRTAIPALLPNPPARTDNSPRVAVPLQPGAETASVRSVATAGDGAWTETGGARAALGSAPDLSLLLTMTVGSGTLELLADGSPLQNRLLSRADNAQFALDLAGPSGRPIVFVESVHGYGLARGLSALPAQWWLGLALLALAGLAFVLARGRRLSPPDVSPPLPPPPRRAYVDAVALLLRRTRKPDDVAAILKLIRDDR